MSGIEAAKQMLLKAESDLRALKGMKKDDKTFGNDIFGFHAQQAVEKSLKAWITYLGIEYPLTHNIITLLSILEENNVKIEKLWGLVKFNSFAVQFRYESLEEFVGELDRDDIIKSVSKLFNRVKKIVGKL